MTKSKKCIDEKVEEKKLTIQDIEALIDKALPEAINTLIAGLKAKDSRGRPDWQVRIACAKCLLNKRIPDLQKQTLTTDRDNPPEIIIKTHIPRPK